MPSVPPKTAASIQVTLIGSDGASEPEAYRSIEGGGVRFEFVEDVEAPVDALPRFTGNGKYDEVTLTGAPLPPGARRWISDALASDDPSVAIRVVRVDYLSVARVPIAQTMYLDAVLVRYVPPVFDAGSRDALTESITFVCMTETDVL